MRIKIERGDMHLIDLATRLPFKYGIATMTSAPHVFVRMFLQVDGQPTTGVAADHLPPKWFTKLPEQSIDSEIDDMLRVIERAVNLATGMQGASAFDCWQQLYEAQLDWGRDASLPPLLTNFGTSLVERALIEAVCRVRRMPFSRAIHENLLGLRLDAFDVRLRECQASTLLPGEPLRKTIVRHTIGMADLLSDDDIPPGEQLDDELPQSLEACIRHYGLKHFKIKVGGDTAHDVDRLTRIAAQLQQHAAPDFGLTLDGNEQFRSPGEFRDYWATLTGNQDLHGLWERLLFIEQPFHRDVALDADTMQELRGWKSRPRMIIDESDAEVGSLAKALELGYHGTSHKNCKGVCKGVANACLIAHRRRQGHPLTLSGEDLANVGPVALLQDLAVAASLGIDHVERNGHHYFRGLTPWPQSIQAATREHHPDLYHAPGSAPGASAPGTTLAITDGRLALASVNAAPFGCGPLLDVSLLPRATAGTLRDAIGAGAP